MFQKTGSGLVQTYDKIRKKWVIVTPEEIVRTLTVSFIQETLGFAASTINVEKKFQLNDEQHKRFDIIVFDRDAPHLLVECKKFDEKLLVTHLNQLFSYQRKIQAKYIMLTNGHQALIIDIQGDPVTDWDQLRIHRNIE